jgi:hypothetical protein
MDEMKILDEDAQFNMIEKAKKGISLDDFLSNN